MGSTIGCVSEVGSNLPRPYRCHLSVCAHRSRLWISWRSQHRGSGSRRAGDSHNNRTARAFDFGRHCCRSYCCRRKCCRHRIRVGFICAGRTSCRRIGRSSRRDRRANCSCSYCRTRGYSSTRHPGSSNSRSSNSRSSNSGAHRTGDHRSRVDGAVLDHRRRPDRFGLPAGPRRRVVVLGTLVTVLKRGSPYGRRGSAKVRKRSRHRGGTRPIRPRLDARVRCRTRRDRLRQHP